MLNNIQTTGSLGGKNVVDYLPTRGKQLVGAPEFSAGVGLDYDDGHWFANVGFKYLGSQYSTFMNDERINGYGRVDASVGYRFDDYKSLKRPEIKLSMFNLTDDHLLTGINSFQNNAQTHKGIGGSTISGSTPNYYEGEGFSFLMTFRAGLAP